MHLSMKRGVPLFGLEWHGVPCLCWGGAQNGFIDEVVCIHLVREEETLLLGVKMVIKTGKEAIPAQRIFFLAPEAPREWRDALHAFNLPEV